MCGIAGIWNATIESPDLVVGEMLITMQHRGPDGQGRFSYPGGAAGMVRLALVDPTDRGQQPMWSPDHRVAILFNGEIYNFREERHRLESNGYQFRSATDTEVILALYLERGLDFVSSLRGMYAIAIFDWRRSTKMQPPTLLVARGPLGIKPLYVASVIREPRSVIFASEIRALLASGLVSAQIDHKAVAEYLATGFIWQPRTIIQDVRMLEPGALAIYHPDGSRETRQFWHVPEYQPRAESLEEAADRLRGILDESIRLHSFADVPVGAFLSGGVDSTAIAALMREHVSKLRTYTLRFPEFPGDDESAEAAEAARVLQIENTMVDVTGADVAASLPKFAGDLDQPSNDGINTWLISKAAASDVKGVLSGLGGDEWFAGYPVTRRMSRYATMPLWWIQTIAAHLASTVADLVPRGKLRDRVANLAARRSALTTWGHSHTVFGWNEVRESMGLNPAIPLMERHYEAVLSTLNANWQRETSVGLSLLLDTRIYMINQLLRDSDATSMAHSLELRVPFVDLKVTEFARSCLDYHKLLPDGGMGDTYITSGSKRVLIYALRDVLPLSIARRPKRGFTVPTYRWLNTNLSELIDDTCHPETIAQRGLVDPRLASRSWNAYHTGADNRVYRKLWALMIFELWCRSVLDGTRRCTTSPSRVSSIPSGK